MMNVEVEVSFHECLDLVEDWVARGECGFALPVIQGKLLEKLKRLTQERKTESCSICNGNGLISDGYEDYACRGCKIIT